MKKPKAILKTYLLGSGKTVSTRAVKTRICWGEPTQDLEIMIEEGVDTETAVYVPLDSILTLIREKLLTH